ncbi:MAG: hypothetical protein LBS25_00880 [Candidatus Symbiothrix sp.]|nr:hypothetical protein [Candidatus Symbiothrix sp.]
MNGFKDKDFVIPALNEGQKVVRAYSVTDNQSVEFQHNVFGKTVLSNFKQTDKDVTVLAVELNKEVMGKTEYIPYTSEVLKKIRPEGFKCDEPAFGSLLFDD